MHNFNYMPDARPVSWPTDFKKQVINIARSLDMPIYDPASLVAQYGTQVALEKDMRHYAKNFVPAVADKYSKLIKIALNDPRSLMVS